MVGISAGERNIVKVFPEKVIKLKVALLCFLFIGIDLEGRQISGQNSHLYGILSICQVQRWAKIGKRDG